MKLSQDMQLILKLRDDQKRMKKVLKLCQEVMSRNPIKTGFGRENFYVILSRLKCSTSNCGSKPTSNKKNDRISRTLSRNMKNKLEAQPKKVNKKNHVFEPIRNVDVKHSLLKANSELICATCKKSMLYGVHDMLPPKKTTSHSVETQKPELKVYCRKPKNVKNIGCSDCSLVFGLRMFKTYEKEPLLAHELSSALGKSKKSSHQPKAEDTKQEKLYLLHMDLCGPMRVASLNGKRYILVIVNDYSRFTWVRFLRTKDEAPEAIIKCIKNMQLRLNATVRNVQIDNGTEFVNQTLREFYENVGISHQISVAHTP
ncbi:retrovirus-related pol polyprotein from transposon TNT 1-94 [Tanacetum coccineum]